MESAESTPALDIASVEAGVDWVTYTVPRGNDADRLWRTACGIISEQEGKGARRKSFGSHGYRGEQVEHAALGAREDGIYFRLSGDLACSKWGEIGSSGGKPTRLDLQTTFLLRHSLTECGQRFFPETPTHPARRGRPPVFSFQRDTVGAWIGRAGSRSSRAYMRVYDKGIESGSHPAGLRWRVEAELKAEYAETQWKGLHSAESTQAYCYASSAYWAQRSGLAWPLPTPSEITPLTPTMEPVPPDVTASLAWLAQQVSPTVQRLVRAGLAREVLACLRLDPDLLESINSSSSSCA
jgi:DNA relaxase NicK